MPQSPLIPIQWIGDATTGFLRLLDQTKLPTEEAYIDCHDVQTVWHAIKRLSVRGAPAIGITAGYGCVLALREGTGSPKERLKAAADYLATSRPTAVNLFWALKEMQSNIVEPQFLLTQAQLRQLEDQHLCQAIGEKALPLFEKLLQSSQGRLPGVLTHCNAGALATAGLGTATAPMYLAHQKGMKFSVFADETRPLLQGARLTAFELERAGLDVTLICDNMAAQVMREGKVQLVIVGADRIAANGDAANKIGTYGLAILAKHHHIPFFVAAPYSTFDLSIPDGSQIPIEERASSEITEGFGKRTAPVDIKTYSPAFDVTPHELITAIITDGAVIQPVNTQTVAVALYREPGERG